jgi:hypothetical protein
MTFDSSDDADAWLAEIHPTDTRPEVAQLLAAVAPTSAVLVQLAARSGIEPGPLDTPCLVWHGPRQSGGYGHVWLPGGRQMRVHRAAWEARHGPIPEGLYVCHRCDNPPCWADGHLFLGTPADNMADKIAKGRA